MLSAYEEQLRLYAALYHEKHGEWPYRLIVISLDGKRRYVDFEKNECLILLEESKKMLRQVNRMIETDEPLNTKAMKLASPSQTTCQFCLYRPNCEPYFLARQNDSAEGWPKDAWGTVVEKKILRNGLGKIVLTPLSGNSPVYIRGLRLERHAALNTFKKIGVFSLCSDNSDNCYKEGQLTTIYGIE